MNWRTHTVVVASNDRITLLADDSTMLRCVYIHFDANEHSQVSQSVSRCVNFIRLLLALALIESFRYQYAQLRLPRRARRLLFFSHKNERLIMLLSSIATCDEI